MSISRHIRWGSDNVIPVSDAEDDSAFTVKNGLRGDINIGEESIDSNDNTGSASLPIRKQRGKMVLPKQNNVTERISMEGMINQLTGMIRGRDSYSD